MPSAFKLEKQTSFEVPDPVKQILTMVEKKVRNLEKRKAKLDMYRNDYKSEKELNDDQKNAIKKYDLVVELLDFAKELQKSFNSVVSENIKLQKKAAKREQLERQQQEMQRIKELLLLQDILVNMGTPEIRNDFLLGSNGALQLDEEKLNQLDEFYKLISPDRNSENEDVLFEDQLAAASDHLTALLDGKNKDVVNTTYKNLKELLLKINDCGYLSPVSKTATTDDCVEDTDKEGEQEFSENVPQGVTEIVPSSQTTETEHPDIVGSCASTVHPDPSYFSSVQYNSGQPQGQPLQEVLPIQGNFNFLQESQINLQPLHMDSAVVVAHPMIPPPTTMGYPTPYHSASNLSSQDIQVSQSEGGMVRPTAVTPGVSSHQQQLQVSVTNNTGSHLQQGPMNPPQDYDPARPIPTQTYTNQNFAAVHPIVPVTIPGNFVSGAITHPLQQMVPVGMVPQHVSRTPSPPSVSDSHTMSIATQDTGVVSTNVNLGGSPDIKEFDSEYQMQQGGLDNGGGNNHFGTSSDYQQLEDTQSFTSNQPQNFAQNRSYAGTAGQAGNRNIRGRGSSNGFAKGNNTPGRTGYGNGRSNYQNAGNYYQVSYSGRDNFNNNATNYNNAYKQKSAARGSAARGINPGSKGGSSGRGGGYRSQ